MGFTIQFHISPRSLFYEIFGLSQGVLFEISNERILRITKRLDIKKIKNKIYFYSNPDPHLQIEYIH